MKTFIALLAVCLVAFVTGCASTAVHTPAELAANLQTQVKRACVVVQPTIASVLAMRAQLTEAEQVDLAKAQALSTDVCTANVAPPASVTDFVQGAFPLVIRIVDGSPLPPQDKAAAEIALTAASVAVSTALAQAQ